MVITTPALIIPAMKRTHKGPKTALENRLVPSRRSIEVGISQVNTRVAHSAAHSEAAPWGSWIRGSALIGIPGWLMSFGHSPQFGFPIVEDE